MTKEQWIKLDPSEILSGAFIGIMRQAQNLKTGRQAAHGAGSENDWQLHIEGALGELAFAKWLNVYCAGTGRFRGPDVGVYEVKTAAKHSHRLTLHKDMDDELIVWLLTGGNGNYCVRGWIKAGDGKRDAFWKDPTGQNRHAYFVPQDKLNPPIKAD